MYRCTVESSFFCPWTFWWILCLGYCNSAVLKITVHVSFWMVIFSGPKLRNGAAGSYDTSMFSVSRKLRTVFHRSLTIYIPPRLWEDFLFCTFSAVITLRSFRRWPSWPVYARHHLVVLFGVDLIITDVDCLSMCFYFYFTSCENNLPLQSGFLKVGPVWNLFFPMIYHRTFLVGRCHLPALSDCHLQAFSDLWLLWAL